MSAWLDVKCPKATCQAEAGQECWRARRGSAKRRTPHRERRKLARQMTGRDFGSQPTPSSLQDDSPGAVLKQ